MEESTLFSKSIDIWFVASALAVFGGYTIWLLSLSGSYYYFLLITLCFTGAIGLTLCKPWSRFLVFAVTFITIARWIYGIITIAFNGLLFSNAPEVIFAFARGLAIILVFVYGSIIVYQYFSNEKTRS